MKNVIDGGCSWDRTIAGVIIFDKAGRERAYLKDIPAVTTGIQVEQMVMNVAETLGLITLEADEPRFMYECVQDGACEFATLSEMLESNRDAEDFCDWLRKAEPGAHFVNGGGAAPRFVTWRVS